MKKAAFCFSVLLCLSALAVSVGCGNEVVRGYTGEQITSINIFQQESDSFYAPNGIALIRSAEEMEEFKGRCEEGHLLGEFVNASFEEKIGAYSSSFFAQGELLVLFKDQPNPCYDSEVIDISAEEETVEIDVNIYPPRGGDACSDVMMQDIYFIELPKDFCGERSLHVNYRVVES